MVKKLLPPPGYRFLRDQEVPKGPVLCLWGDGKWHEGPPGIKKYSSAMLMPTVVRDDNAGS